MVGPTNPSVQSAILQFSSATMPPISYHDHDGDGDDDDDYPPYHDHDGDHDCYNIDDDLQTSRATNYIT